MRVLGPLSRFQLSIVPLTIHPFSNRELLNGLQKTGFRLDYNWDGSGALIKMYERAGGYYVGPCPFLYIRLSLISYLTIYF